MEREFNLNLKNMKKSLQKQNEELNEELKAKVSELLAALDCKNKVIEEFEEYSQKIRDDARTLERERDKMKLQLMDSVRKDFCLQAIAAATGHYHKEKEVF